MRGPIDYILVGFEDLKFDGSILGAVGQAIDSGAIALVAVAAVAKDPDGVVTSMGLADTGDDEAVAFVQKYQSHDELIGEDDIAEVGELLEPGTGAGFLVVEQLWALPLKKALLDAKAFLIAEGRIHPEAAAELNVEGV